MSFFPRKVLFIDLDIARDYYHMIWNVLIFVKVAHVGETNSSLVCTFPVINQSYKLNSMDGMSAFICSAKYIMEMFTVCKFSKHYGFIFNVLQNIT